MDTKLGCKIKLGDWLEWLIDKVTFGRGSYWSYVIAVEWLGYKSCGCDERKYWLNKLTCNEYKDE
tara:strand:- start:10345 stop:10539 length:195 start_codon:yes stop_codon:yes gene_type:complete